MKPALVLVLLALAPLVRAGGENDEDTAVPGLIPAGSFMLYYDSAGPLSFVAMTPKDKPKGAPELGTFRGVSCQHGLSIPISADVRGTSISGAVGNGSFVKAIKQIKTEHPDVVGIYDGLDDTRSPSRVLALADPFIVATINRGDLP